MKSKNILGVEKELLLNDFEVSKLSDKLGVMELNGYRMVEKSIKDVNGTDMKVTVLSVQCVSLNTGKQVKVDVLYDGTNKGDLDTALAELRLHPLTKQFVDFHDCIVGHYLSGSGAFANVTQTYKANRIVRLEPKDAERILKGDTQPTPQSQQPQQPNKG